MAELVDGVVSGPEVTYPPIQHGLGRYFLDKLRHHGRKIAQVHVNTGHKLTFLDIVCKGIRCEQELRSLGVQKGDVVAVFTGITHLFPPVLLGTLLRGAAIAPMNILFDKDDIKRSYKLLEPKVVIAQENLLPKIVEMLSEDNDQFVVKPMKEYKPVTYEEVKSFQVEEDEDDLNRTCIILMSSGTTGFPKGVCHTAATSYTFLNYLNSGEYVLPTDVSLQFAGYFWVSGLYQQFQCFELGNLNVMVQGFNEEVVLKAIQDYKVSYVMIAPHVLCALTKYPALSEYDISSIRVLGVGGASLCAEVQTMAQDALKINVRQAYAMTEAMLITSGFNSSKLGSVGALLPNVKAKVVDHFTEQLLGTNERGEIYVKSPSLTPGYYKDPASTAIAFDEDGWFRTGDLGYYDEDMYFYVVDRAKDLIKYKGIQVSPPELEGLLLSHPAVKEVAVVGCKHLLDQERATAFVVKQPDASCTEDELINLVKSRFAEHKWLHGGVRFIEELPKTVTGKVKRGELREMLTQTT